MLSGTQNKMVEHPCFKSIIFINHYGHKYLFFWPPKKRLNDKWRKNICFFGFAAQDCT